MWGLSASCSLASVLGLLQAQTERKSHHYQSGLENTASRGSLIPHNVTSTTQQTAPLRTREAAPTSACEESDELRCLKNQQVIRGWAEVGWLGCGSWFCTVHTLCALIILLDGTRNVSFLSELNEDRGNSVFKEIGKDTIWLEFLQISMFLKSRFHPP